MENILLISTGSVAQVLAITPAVSVLKKNFPQIKITVLTDKPGIFGNNSSVKETWQEEAFPAIVQKIKAANFDASIIFEPSLKYAAITKAAGIKKRIGPSNLAINLLLTNPVKSLLPKNTHKVKLYTELLSPLFVFTFPAEPVLFVSRKENEWAKKFLSDLGITPTQKFICINPAFIAKDVSWPKENYATLIDKISIKYPSLKVLLVCKSSKEIATANEIYWRSIKKPYIVREVITLNNLAAVINRAAAVIAGYNSPSHIAAALGKPTVAFCPEDKNIIKPFSALAHIITPKESAGSALGPVSVEQVMSIFDRITAKILKQRKGVLSEEGTFSFFNN